jgi:hypothetical protein
MCSKAMKNESALPWEGLRTVAVFPSDTPRPNTADRSHFDEDFIDFSLFEKILPFIRKNLQVLIIGSIWNLDYLRSMMKLLGAGEFPARTTIEFRFQPVLPDSSSESPPLPTEEDVVEWGKILSSLREVRAPETENRALRFLSHVLQHASPPPHALLVNGAFLRRKSPSPSDLLESLSVFRDFSHLTKVGPAALKTLWFQEASSANIGTTSVQCTTFMHHAAATRPDTGTELLRSTLAFIGGDADEAVNARRIGDKSFGLTPFHVAIGTNRVGTVRLLLEKFKPDLSVRCFEELHPLGYNALELACVLQLVDIVELLLSSRSEHYLQSTAAENLFRLYNLAQRQISILRSTGSIYYAPWYPTVDPPVDGTMNTIVALDNFFGSKFPLSSLRDAVSGHNLLHRVCNIDALKYFVSRDVDLHAVDSEGTTPYQRALNGFRSDDRPNAIAMSLAKLDKTPLEANTPRIQQLLHALAEYRLLEPESMDKDEELLELERKVWGVASKKDIETGHQKLGGLVHSVNLLFNDFGSNRPFLQAMKEKHCVFPANFGKDIEDCLKDALIPNRPTRRSRMTTLDGLKAAAFALQSAFQGDYVFLDRSLPSTTTLDLVCRPLWTAPDSGPFSGEEKSALLEIAHIMVDGYVKHEMSSPINLAALQLPADDTLLSPQSRELKEKIKSAVAALEIVDQQFADEMNEFVRVDTFPILWCVLVVSSRI